MWHIYPAEDADKIRACLRQVGVFEFLCVGSKQNRISVES